MLRDGVPCSHPGCLSHISHPCEVCGRIAGMSRKCTITESEIQEWVFWSNLATPGPWYQEKDEGGAYPNVYAGDIDICNTQISSPSNGSKHLENASFIAASREALPRLIEAYSEHKEYFRKLEQVLRSIEVQVDISVARRLAREARDLISFLEKKQSTQNKKQMEFDNEIY